MKEFKISFEGEWTDIVKDWLWAIKEKETASGCLPRSLAH